MRPFSDGYELNGISPRGLVHTTIASQGEQVQNYVGADRYSGIVNSPMDRICNVTEHKAGALLNVDKGTTSNSPSNTLNESEHDIMMYRLKEPTQELELEQRSHETAISNELTERIPKLPLSAEAPLIPSLKTELSSATEEMHSNSSALTENTMESTTPTYRSPPQRRHVTSPDGTSQKPFSTIESSVSSFNPVQDKTPPLRRTHNPITSTPVVGKVYFIPDGGYFPASVIHMQKQQEGFFKHPVLVTDVDHDFAYFYALTKSPPAAIGEMAMCLRMGNSTADEGIYTLRLANGSLPMQTETWMNLEQRFYIECENLNDWAIDVRINTDDLWKLFRRIQELEARQNRFLYKPLPRDMSLLQPGTVVMLLNNPQSSTLGAPVLIVENQYPYLRYLRIKEFSDNPHFNPTSRRTTGPPRHRCLEICKYPKWGHDGTPIMLVESDSPEMRESSYVEVYPAPSTSTFHMCKTWCWPPVVIQSQSMAILRGYSSFVGARFNFQTTSRSLFVGPTTPFRNGVPQTQHGNVGYQSLPQQHGYQAAVPPPPPHTSFGFRQPVQNSQLTGVYGHAGAPYSPSMYQHCK
ncbi:uncharacterized protein J4E87_008973 [Alternaria ethzedia]|uniref:uncharacterized protein n=1 Tax=Alternaria ethzedia TaxID=181014 RepID=UPI0020C513E8|nr:uncharacterized protein J4E87_008973 [Alternaria ethzedia]KAI4615516.1 hypothetical protein J4E87_008973 [Alternaria ethzedia]